MIMSVDESDGVSLSVSESRKRHKYGSVFEASKKLRNTTYETGEDCRCKRHDCFVNVSKNERDTLIRHFNGLGDRNSQNAFLSGLV